MAVLFRNKWERYIVAALVALYFIILIVQGTAKAEDIVLKWANTTGAESCTTVPGDYTQAGTRIWQLVAEVDAPAEEVILKGFEPGEYQFKATSYTTDGVESRLTETAIKNVTTLQTVDTKAYSVAKIIDAFFLIVVGTVPLGTDCIVEQTVNGKYAVPRANVTFSGVNDSGIVVADCG